LASGAVDIIQPDPSHAGGITETRKIATMAEAYDVAVALHCPLGPIALATCLQIDGCTYNAVIQEQSLGIHYNVGNDLLDYLTIGRSSTTRNASSPSQPRLAWASTSTRITSENAPRRVIVGATQSGATRMDPSLNGDKAER